jgi:hypothetical protein
MASQGLIAASAPLVPQTRILQPFEIPPRPELVSCMAAFVLSHSAEDQLAEADLRTAMRQIPDFADATTFELNKAIGTTEVSQARGKLRERKHEIYKDQLTDAIPVAITALVEQATESKSELVRVNAAKALLDASGVKAARPDTGPTVQTNVTINNANWRDTLNAPTVPQTFNVLDDE